MSASVFHFFFWGLMPFFFSLVLVFFVRGYLVSQSLLDKPNERSSHTIPTPRGGGLGFMPIIFIFGFVYALFYQDNLFLFWQFSFVFLLCIISFLDDLFDLSAKYRFLAQIALVTLSLSFSFPNFFNLTDIAALNVFLFIGFLFGWVWFINLYNFMDGIDGLSALQTLCLTIGLALVFPEYNSLYLLIGACVLGFFFWNAPPAKIFMGDIGSIGLGFLLGYFLINLALRDYDGFLQALILPLYYLSDTTITLGKRLYQRKKIWQAHREHFYQKVTTSHKKTHVWANIYILFCNVCLILCALWVPVLGLFSLIFACIAVWVLLSFFNKAA